MVNEQWLDVINYHREYEVSNLGRIRSVARVVERGGDLIRRHTVIVASKMLTAWPLKSGHLMVRLYHCGDGRKKGKDFGVHRLVLSAFHGPCPDGMECRHLDGIPTNNRVDNLRWGTRKENIADQNYHGTFARGSKSGKAKLREVDVPKIRCLLEEGKLSMNKIAIRFKVNVSAVWHIHRGLTWRHVP